MNISIRPARVESDLVPIQSLLDRCGLPQLAPHSGLENFFVVTVGGKIVACAGLEVYGKTGLARSLAVEESERKRGFGANLLDKLAEHARELGLQEVYALTTTAPQYMQGHGFTVVDRSDVPQVLLDSAQFESQCPVSAVVLRKSM